MGHPQVLWAAQESGTEVAAAIRLQLRKVQHSAPEARPVLCSLVLDHLYGVMSQTGLGERAVTGCEAAVL